MHVEQIATIGDVDRFEWDALAGDDVFASHGWLETIETTCLVRGEQRYFLIRDRDGLDSALDSHHRRLNGVAFPFDATFLPMLKELLADRVTIYVARQDGRPISVVVGFRAGDAMFLPMVGMDGERQRSSFVYFNNSYNVPIEDAIASGVRRIYCGKLVYEMKTRRGFTLLPLSMYLLPPHRMHRAALRAVVAAQGVRMRAMMRG